MSGLAAHRRAARADGHAGASTPRPSRSEPPPVRYFGLAVGDDNPLYSDAAFARAQGLDGVTAPPTLICETNQYAGPPARTPTATPVTPGASTSPAPARCAAATPTRSTAGSAPTTSSPRPGRSTTWPRRDPRRAATCWWSPPRATYTNQHGELLAVNDETIILVGLEVRMTDRRAVGDALPAAGAHDHAGRHGRLRRRDLGLVPPALRPGVRRGRQAARPGRRRAGLRRAVRRAAPGLRSGPRCFVRELSLHVPEPDVRRRDRPLRGHRHRGRRPTSVDGRPATRRSLVAEDGAGRRGRRRRARRAAVVLLGHGRRAGCRDDRRRDRRRRRVRPRRHRASRS